MVYFAVTGMMAAIGMVFFSDSNAPVKRAWYLAVAFSILFWVAALRSPAVGTDYAVYLREFQDAARPFSDLTRDYPFEWGYLLFTKCLRWVSGNPVWFAAATSGCILLPIARLIYRYSRIPWLSVCLFATLLFYAMSLTAIREYLALAILLSGLPVLKKSRLLFCVFVLAAASFHLTALLFLLVPLFYGVQWTRRTVLLFLAAGTAAFFLAGHVIDWIAVFVPKYGLYRFSTYANGLRPISFVKCILIGITLLFAWAMGYDRKAKGEREALPLLLCVMLAFLMALLEIRAVVFDRAIDFFAVFIILLLPDVLSGIRAKESRMLGIWTVLAVSFIYAGITLVLRSGWYHVTSYSWIFT